MNLFMIKSHNSLKKIKGIISYFRNESFYYHILFLYIFYAIINIFFLNSISLEKEIYFSSSIFISALSTWGVIFLFIFTIFLYILNNYKFKNNYLYKKLFWKKDGLEGKIRYVILISLGLLVWYFTAMELNAYFNQDYLFDKLFLISIFILSIFSPIFLFLCVGLMLMLGGQVNYPAALFVTWTDKLLLINFIFMFCAYLIMKNLPYKKINSIKVESFFFLAIVMHASYYFYSFVAKIIIAPNFFNWVLENKISNLFVTAHSYNAMGIVINESVLKNASFFSSLDLFMMIAAFALQFGSLFILKNKKICTFAFLEFIILHISIFLASGIFFWKWIIYNLVLFFILLSMENKSLNFLFTKEKFYLSLILIPLSIFFFTPTVLGWYDTKVNHIYVLEAITEDGEIYPIERNFFSPYDASFAQNRFTFLDSDKKLVGTFGITKDYDLYHYSENINKSQVKDLYDNYGEVLYDYQRELDFYIFLNEYIHNINERGSKDSSLSFFKAPYHMYPFNKDESKYEFQSKIKQIRITSQDTFYDGDNISITSSRLISTINISKQSYGDLIEERSGLSREFDLYTHWKIKFKTIPNHIQSLFNYLLK